MAEEDAQSTLQEAMQRIKNLMDQEKWLDAHRACLEILRFDPDNLKVIRLKNKIEKEVKQLNIRAIKEDLKNIQPLWEERKYEELLEHLKELEPYRKEYKPLDDFIKKVQKAYFDKKKEEQKEYYEEEIKRIEALLEADEYQEALRAAQKLRLMKIDEPRIKRMVQKIKDGWINDELKQSEELWKSKKYEDALLKAQQIKKIDPNSTKVKKLIESTKERYQKHKIMEKRDFIYKGLEKTKTLYQLKKFDKAMEAAQEILDIDPENQKAQQLFMKAKKKMSKSTSRELRSQMKKAHKKMKEEYKKNKDKYIRI